MKSGKPNAPGSVSGGAGAGGGNAGGGGKDRGMAKSAAAGNANPKKRTPSSGGGVGTPAHANPQTPGAAGPGGTATGGSGSEDADVPIVIWPEWNDAEIAGEKWGGSKHVFEDPEGPVTLPRSLRLMVDCYKRPMELPVDGSIPLGVQPAQGLDEMFHSIASASSPLTTAGGGLGASGLPSSVSFPIDPLGGLGDGSAPGDGGPEGSDANANSQSFPPDSAGGANIGGPLDNAPFPPIQSPPDTVSASMSSQVNAIGTETPGGGNPSGVIAEETNPSSVSGSQAVSWAPLNQSNNNLSQPSSQLQTPNHTQHQIQEPMTKISEDEAGGGEPENLAGTSKFFQCNRHVVHSELMRSILIHLHFLYEHSRISRSAGIPDEFCPWDGLYPKGKDGLPMYSATGKYAVKLHWLGSWRRVTVDDRIPVDEQGRPLVISSPLVHELWPLLVSKALLKLAAVSHREQEGVTEHGDFDPLHALKGWVPERIQMPVVGNLGPLMQSALGPASPTLGNIWDAISTLNIKLLQSKSLGAGDSYLGGSSGLTVGKTDGAVRGSVYGAPPVIPSTADRGDRSNLHSASVRNAMKANFMFIFAARDGDDASDKLDLNSLSCPFRICEFKDGASALKEGEQGYAQRLVKLKSYFTCGNIRNRRTTDIKGKPTDEPYEPITEGTEFWVTFGEFCKSYRHIVIYHSPASFKTIKSTSCIIDPAKPVDMIRVPPVLYLPDQVKQASIIVSISTFGRCKVDALPQFTSVIVEPYEWLGLSSPFNPAVKRKPYLRICTNSIQASILKVSSSKKAFRFVIDCPTSYNITFYSRDDFLLEDEGKYLSDKLGLHVRDVDEGFPAQSANSWFVLFKNVVKFTEPTFLAPILYVPDSIQNTSCLRMFDNDTNEEIPQVFYNLRPRLYVPNKPGPIFTPERPLEISIRPNLQDFEDVFTPNKHNILFRLLVKVKDAPENFLSAQLTFSLPMVWMRIQLFDNDVEVAAGRGRGVVTLHSLQLVQTFNDDYLPGNGAAVISATNSNVAPAASSSQTAAGKKEAERAEKAAAEKKEKEREEREKEREKALKENKELTASGSLVPLTKHKYVLQGSVEQIELTRIQSAGTKDPTDPSGARPASRAGTGGASGPKATNSAKKKKSGAGSVAGSTTAASPSVADAASPAAAQAPSGSPVSDPLTWKLRLISTDAASLIVARDTEKEDRYKAIKDGWEAAQPGRAAKAKEAREAYLKQVEAGMIKPMVIMAAPPIVTPIALAATPPPVKGTDLLFKPWTIIKDNGVNGKQLNSFRDRNLSVFNLDGKRLSVEASPIPNIFASPIGAEVIPASSSTMLALAGAPVAAANVSVIGSTPAAAPTNSSGGPGSAGTSRKSISKSNNADGSRSSVNTPPPGVEVTPTAQGVSGQKGDQQVRPSSGGLAVDTAGSLSRNAMAPVEAQRRGSTMPPPPPESAALRRQSAMNIGSDERLTPGIDMSGGAFFPGASPTGADGVPTPLLAAQAPGGPPQAPVMRIYSPSTGIPTLQPRVLTPEERSSRDMMREEIVQSHERLHEQTRVARQKDREGRQRIRQQLAEKVEMAARVVEKEREEDLSRREAYRQRVIRELEDAARKAMEAQRAAEMAALEVSNAEEAAAGILNDKEKKKKPGKR
ncbi:hypothetical protein HK101_005088 [Irineochytrium annulatum]|nr:hypothetical protein HK101_005088 [Irineochytrium annulatum]